jgi:mRNA interferase MazF
MSFPRQGEIFAVQLPGRATDKEKRPALVVSPDFRNEYADDVLVVPITSNLRPMPTHVLLSAGSGGLSRPSMAKAEQITALPKALLSAHPFGPRISRGKLREVQHAVWLAVGGED